MSDRARRRAAQAQSQSTVSEIVEARTAPDAVVTEQVTEGTPKSIRNLIMGMILAGKDTKTIAASVQQHFPDSAAARKSTKHIAWYRSRMKKDGQLPVKAAETAPVVDAATAS